MKKKLEAEVIKLIVKRTLKELWGAESHRAYFFRSLPFVAFFQVISKTFQMEDQCCSWVRLQIGAVKWDLFHLEFLAQPS